MPEYEAWKETAAPGWTVKYYKGLGTSDKKEAQEYFADIDLHRKTFVHEGTASHASITRLRTSKLHVSLGSPTSGMALQHSAGTCTAKSLSVLQDDMADIASIGCCPAPWTGPAF